MKFSSLQHTKSKALKVRAFTGGTNLARMPFDIPDGALSDSLNIQRSGNIITARQGLSAGAGDVIASENPYGFNTFSYYVTDSAFYIDGEYKKAAVEEYCDYDAQYYCRIYFIGIDGSKTNAGYFLFERISNDVFYNPESILFFKGAKLNGAGIFAFVRAANIYSPEQKTYRIYELSSNKSNWIQIKDYYTPVIYINGRGTRYEEARMTGLAYTAQPKTLESLNMLTGRFKAYFTSDGRSSCFRLPISELSNEAVICRVYTSPAAYTEWTVMPNKTSAVNSFYSAQITLNVDRSKGMIYFTDKDGDYPVPMMSMYHENNICITAVKTTAGNFESALSCTCCTEFSSRLIFSGGNENGKIISVSAANPLYFPINSTVTAGDGTKGITALLSHKDGVIAFNEAEIYSLTLNNGAALNSTSLLADNPSIFYGGDTLKIKKITDTIGCKSKSCCIMCGKTPVFMGTDRNIYSLNISASELSELSKSVKPYLEKLSDKEIQNAKAVVSGGYYLLLTGSKSVIMDFEEKGLADAAWYIWDFGKISVIGGAAADGKLRLFCTGSDGGVFYTARLSGNFDTDIRYDKNTPNIKNERFSSHITTKHFDFGNIAAGKLIESIFISAAADGELEISVNGKHYSTLQLGIPDLDCGCGTLKSVKLTPHLSRVGSLYITLKSNAGFSLGELIIYYRETV